MAYASTPTIASGSGNTALYTYDYGSYSETAGGDIRIINATGPYTLPRGDNVPADGTPWHLAPGLKSYAQPKGLGIGCAIPSGAFSFSNPDMLNYRNAVAAECNLIGGNTQFKMESSWPSLAAATEDPDIRFVEADKVRTYADANGMLMRGHVLVWHRGMEDWVNTGSATVGQLTPGNRTAAEKLMRNWIGAAMGRYRGRIEAWDVINEVTDGAHGTGFRANMRWYDAYGNNDYVKDAFFIARDVDPSARLVWCEEDLEHKDSYFEARRTAVLKNLESLLRAGVPINTLALQGHICTLKEIDQTQLRTFLRNVAGLGLTIEVTELDVDDRNFALLDRGPKGRDYLRKFLDVILDEPHVLNVMFWDMVLSDGNWLNDTDGSRYRWPTTEKQLCLPLNRASAGYSRMDMWNGVRECLRSAPNHKAIRDKLRGRVI